MKKFLEPKFPSNKFLNYLSGRKRAWSPTASSQIQRQWPNFPPPLANLNLQPARVPGKHHKKFLEPEIPMKKFLEWKILTKKILGAKVGSENSHKNFLEPKTTTRNYFFTPFSVFFTISIYISNLKKKKKLYCWQSDAIFWFLRTTTRLQSIIIIKISKKKKKKTLKYVIPCWQIVNSPWKNFSWSHKPKNAK